MKKLRIVLMAVLMLITSVPASALTVSAQSAGLADERTIVREVTVNRSTRGDIEISSFTVTGVVSGAEQQANGDWVWTPSNEASGHKFVFRVAFSVSGTVSLPAGSISIRIPLHILKDKNGSFADAIKVSYPAREDALDTNVFAYDIDEASNTVIITNLLDINEAIDSYFEVSYFTTRRTCDYYDYDPQGTQSYDDASDPFSAHIEIVAEDGNLSADTENVPVYINTSAKLISTEKRYPNIYRSFNSSWANYADPTQAPGRIWNKETGSWQDVTFNVDEYDYLIWEVKSKIKKDVTQYYRFTLDDHDYIDNTPIQYPEDDDLILVGYRFAGQSSYSLQNYVDNQTLDGDRYDWVLTAVKKSTYEKLNFSWYEESTQYIWSVKNSVTATLDPVDQVDPDSTAGGDRTFQYENHFVPIPGIFKVYKFGNINWNAAKRTELLTGYPAYWDYSSYQLREFAAGQIDHFDLFYAICAYGTPNKFTVRPGEDQNDPENYWKSPITYIVTDENLRLQYEEVNGSREGVNYSPDGELLLTEGDGPVLGYRDYYLKKLYFKLTISDAVYASEEFGFVGVDGTFGDSEAVYLEVLTGKGWMPAATYYPSDQSFSEVESRYITLTETNVTPTEGPRCSQHDYVAVSFKEDYGIYGYRLKTTNTHFYTRIDAMPVFTLKHDEESGRVMELVNWLLEEGNDKGGTMFIFNEVNHTVNTAYDQLQNEYIYSGNILQSTESSRYTYKEYEWARDAVRVSEMDSSLSKKVVGASNNTANEEYTVSWKVIMKEELTDQQGRSYIPQDGGTFYDLLPAGLTLDRNSVAVQYEGGYLTINNGINVRTIDNYQGTGRTMLIVEVTTPGKYYNLYYDTICSWDSLSAFGREVLNPVAYQTGNDRIADGYPDDGGNLTGDNKDLMSNLFYDQSQTDIPEQFIYAQQTFDIDAITNAIAGLYKRVKNEAEDSRYKAETMVEPNGTYSYLLRFKNTLTTSARDLVFFDSLENYARGSEHQYPSDWHGTLIDLDLSTLIAQGIRPKVYVSTTSNLDVSAHNDLTEASVWTLLDESKWHDAAELAGVKAIAIDMREAADGKDFVLEANGTIMATLYMKAPAAATRNSGEIYPETYNNIYISSTLINEVHDEESFFIHQDYTTVKFRPKADVHIHKVNAQDRNENIKGIVFTLYGESEYGTVYDKNENLVTTDASGNATFSAVEPGTYILQEFAGNDDWVEDHTEHQVQVVLNDDGTVSVFIDGTETTDAYYQITNIPRIHTDIQFFKRDLSNPSAAVTVVTFKLHTDCSYYGSEITLYAQTDSRGIVNFYNVERGTYTLKEIECTDENYLISDTVWTVVVDSDGNYSISGENSELLGGFYRIYNEPLHGFSLVKLDGYYKTPIAGVKFRLTGISNNGTEYNMEKTTGADGIITFEGLESGVYTLQETYVDEELYMLDAAEHIVQINEDGKVYVDPYRDQYSGYWYSRVKQDSVGHFIFYNQRKEGQITIHKIWHDRDDADRPTDGKYPAVVIKALNVPSNEKTYWVNDFSNLYSTDVKNKIVSFQRNSELTEEEVLALNPVRVDDRVSDKKIYVWYDEDYNAYWWSDAPVTYAQIEEHDGLMHYPMMRHYSMFRDLSGIEYIDISGIDFSGDNFEYLFYNDSKLKKIDGLETLNTTNTRSMAYMFYNCSSLESVNLSSFDASNCKDMSYMFYNCSSLLDLDLSSFNTAKVRDMSYMFNNCSSLVSLNVSSLDTRSCTNMAFMFADCQAVTAIDVSGFDTSHVTNMGGMFYNCKKVEVLDVSGFNTSNLETVFLSNRGMFEECQSVKKLDLSSFNTSKITRMSNMFYDCKSLESLDISGFDTSNVSNIGGMFNGLAQLKVLDLSSFDWSNMSLSADAFVRYCGNLETIYVSSNPALSGSYYYLRDCDKLVGGNGTTMVSLCPHYPNNVYVNAQYVCIDTDETPGLLTYKVSGGITPASEASEPVTEEMIDIEVRVHWEVLDPSKAGTYIVLFPGDHYMEPQLWSLYRDYKYVGPSDLTEEDPTMAVITFHVPAGYDYFIEQYHTTYGGWNNEEYYDMMARGSSYSSVIEGNAEDGFDVYNRQVYYSTTDANQGNWVHNADGTWTFLFKVVDDTLDYIAYEYPYGSYVTDHPSSNPADVVDKEAEINNTYYREVNEDLILKKELVGHDDPDAKFLFKITLDIDPDEQYYTSWYNSMIKGTHTYGEVDFFDGVGYVTLKDGESVYLSGLSARIIYRIEEIVEGSYEVEVPVNAEGKIVEDINITVNVSASKVNRVYVNTYSNALDYTDNGDGSYSFICDGRQFTATLEFANENTPNTCTGITISDGETETYSKFNGYGAGKFNIPKVQEVIFKNTPVEIPVGSFSVKKTTDGNESLQDVEFTFYAELSGLRPGNRYSLSDGTTFKADSTGTADVVFTLKADETITFQDLPIGCTYRITEKGGEYQASYTVTDSAQAGTISSASGTGSAGENLSSGKETLEEGEEVTITFNNIIKQYTDLELTKKVEGSDTEEAFSFRIILSGLEAETTYFTSAGTMTSDEDGKAVKSVFLAAGETFVISDIPVGAEYEITELASAAVASYAIGDEKAENQQPYTALSTGTVIIESPEKITVEFVNKFDITIPEEVKTPLSVRKQVVDSNGNEYQYTDAFRFTVTPVDENNPMPEDASGNKVTEVTVNGNGTVSFGNITFSETGTYEYTVREVTEQRPDIEYDEEVYTVRFTVGHDDDGNMTVQKQIFDSMKVGYEEIVFTNSVRTIDISGTKTWNDNGNEDGRRPEAITVFLKADGMIVDSRTVSEADGWAYEFTGLPVYDGEKEIKYEIDEAEVKDYEKTISGYDLINTPIPPETPPTGDINSLGLGLTMMMSSAASLCCLSMLKRKEEEEQA